jgi:hypothetical protein
MIGNLQIQARHGPTQDIRYEHLSPVALVVDGQVPRAIEERRIHQGRDQIPMAIQNEKRARGLNGGRSAVDSRHAAHKDEPAFQYTQSRGETQRAGC